MSKIVCDICGATYPETETQCPICGTAKPNTPAAGDTAEAVGYAFVKGGRFSKANVKKRNGNQELPREVVEPAPKKEPAPQDNGGMPQLEQAPPAPEPEKPAKPEKQKPERPRRERRDEPSVNIGLIIIVILLVLAIVAVCVYIGMKWVQRINHESTEPSTSTYLPGPTDGTNVPGPISIPCTGLSLPYYETILKSAGEVHQLSPKVQPADTTEKVGFISADSRIATVDEFGNVTAVADGETVIYITCGSYKVEFTVICDVGVSVEETTVPTEPVQTQPEEPFVVLVLNRTDFSLNGYGAKWNLYTDGAIDPAEITWTSSNENVATVTNGVVVAVGNGKAVITAEYQGQIATCDVYCNNVIKASFSLSHTEVTIKVGESFNLQGYDSEGLRIDPSLLKFYTEKEGFITVDENGRVTGVQNNLNYKEAYKIVYVEYNGEVLKCIVRVKDAG